MKNLKYLYPYFPNRLLSAVFGFYVRKEEKTSLNTSNIKCLEGRRGSGDQLCNRMFARVGVLTGL